MNHALLRSSISYSALIICFLAIIPNVFSITFELTYGQRKCFTEELPPTTDTQGSLHVAGGRGDMSLDLFVSDMKGVVYFHKQNVNSVKFSFRTGNAQPHEAKGYRFCVLNQNRPQHGSSQDAVRRVTLDIKAVSQATKQAFGTLAKQDHADKVYNNFLTVSSEVDMLIEKMDMLREQERQLSEINEQTSSMILRLSIIACIFTIGTGVASFASLKNFFKRKKLA